jgi:hypothetical protein
VPIGNPGPVCEVRSGVLDGSLAELKLLRSPRLGLAMMFLDWPFGPSQAR